MGLDEPGDGLRRLVRSLGQVHGWPTLADALLYELATLSGEGAASGHLGTGAFQTSPDYLQRVFDECSVSIWEHWRGLALRDACAFLAWDESMPILRLAEGRYYLLYLHVYYVQLRLHGLSEAIVEHRLDDLRRAREIRQRLMELRNQFWFREAATGFQGVEVARAMRAGMQLDALFESVSSEIADVGDYVDRKAEAGRERLIASLLALLFPVSLAWDLWVEDWVKPLAEGLSWADPVVRLAAVALTVAAMVAWILRRPLMRLWCRWRSASFFRLS